MEKKIMLLYGLIKKLLPTLVISYFILLGIKRQSKIESRDVSKPIKIVAITMLAYAVFLLLDFVLHYSRCSVILAIPGIIYLICSFDILKFKNWARVVVIIFSGLISICFIYLLIITFFLLFKSIIQSFGSGSATWDGVLGGAMGLGMGFFSLIYSIPALLFLIFFTRPKVKEQFK